MALFIKSLIVVPVAATIAATRECNFKVFTQFIESLPLISNDILLGGQRY